MIKNTRSSRRRARHRRVRAKIVGSLARPRLSLFRSNKHLYVQLIDDEKGRVLASASDVKTKSQKRGVELAKEIGRQIAQKAEEQKIKKIVFDRSGYKYHGQIKVLAEEMRAQGVTF